MTLKGIAKLLFTIFLTFLILKFVGFQNLTKSLKSVDLYPLFGAFVFFPLVILCGAEKWRLIIKNEAPNVTFRNALISFLGGMTFGLLTPGRVGEFGRIAFIKEGRKSALAGIAFIDKVIDLEVTLFLGVFGVYYLWHAELALLMLFGVMVGLIFIFYPNLIISLLKDIINYFPFANIFNNIISAILEIPKKILFLCLGYRLLASIIDIIQFFLLINSFHPIHIKYVFIAYPIIILSNILPLTIGGIGIRESISALILYNFGIPFEAAVNASFLLFCVNTLTPGLLGAVLIPRNTLKK